MASPDVRVRVRESVIRVRVGETAIRAVIRITAPQDQLILLYLPLSPVGVRSEAATGTVALCCATLPLAVVLPRKGQRVFSVSKNKRVLSHHGDVVSHYAMSAPFTISISP